MPKGPLIEELLRHAVLLVIGTGISEGKWWGPEESQRQINEYIEETGGWDHWVNEYYKEYER